MSLTPDPRNLLIKGKYDFLFEFKLAPTPNGTNIKYIRYRDGEREFAGNSQYIYLGLLPRNAEDEEKKNLIRKTLLPVVGSTNSLIKKVEKWFFEKSF